MKRRTFLAAAALAIAFGAAGCAAGSGGGSGGGSLNRLTAEELAEVQNLDAEQAIQRLRSRWLRGRGGATPSVIVDGAARPEGMDALSSIRVSDVEEMQFLSANDATLRYGTGNSGGAIIITTKR